MQIKESAFRDATVIKKVLSDKKTVMKFVLFALLVFAFAACTKYQKDNLDFTIERYHCANTKINGETIRVCFDSLVSDSRCPANANCIWSGEATVKLSIQRNRQTQSFKLSTLNATPIFRNDTTVFGYHVKLLSVTPYPGENSQDPYRVELSITN